MIRLALLFMTSVLILGCARGEVTRADWEAMTAKEKDLIIESFRGQEAARDAKGGTGRLHPRSTAFYRERIDEMYASGDTRTVTAIWEELVEAKLPTPERTE